MIEYERPVRGITPSLYPSVADLTAQFSFRYFYASVSHSTALL